MRTVIGLVAAAIIAASSLATIGCDKNNSASPAPKAAERTRFFSELSAKPAAPDALKKHLGSKFPDLDFDVRLLGPMPVPPGPDESSRSHLELQVIISRKNEASQDTDKAYPLILGELEAYLKGLATPGGVEVVGPVRDNAKDGKKIGFRFDYKSAENAGTVSVEPQEKSAGTVVVVVEERG